MCVLDSCILTGFLLHAWQQSGKVRNGELRNVAGFLRNLRFGICEDLVSFEICEVGWLPIVQHSPHEASGASTDVHEGVVVISQATMAEGHSERVGLLSQFSALVRSQDSLLLRIEWPCFSLALAPGFVALG